MQHITQRVPINGECEAGIYKQSQGFIFKGKPVGGKKKWPRADRHQHKCVGCLVRSRVESKRCVTKDYGGQKRWKITDSGSTSAPRVLTQHGAGLIHGAVTPGGAARRGRPGGSRQHSSTPRTQTHTHTRAHTHARTVTHAV